MPRKAIDYSKCLIYKLCCDDPTITDIYVGHTTDKIRRKREHKSRCNNQNSEYYNFYVYQFIRENGGWDNWSLVVLQEYPCENKNQAEMRERYWIETQQSTLNKVIPTRTKQEWNEENQEKLNEYQNLYHQEKKQKIREQRKQYRKKNKEELKEIKKIYYQENKEKIKEKVKQYMEEYREKHREQNREYQKQYKQKNNEMIECECGSTIKKINKLKHIKSEKHNNYLNSLNHELI
jgi:vacuolar-type H+-ATPase subunit I/STV1